MYYSYTCTVNDLPLVLYFIFETTIKYVLKVLEIIYILSVNGVISFEEA